MPSWAVRLYPAASGASEAIGQVAAAVMEPGRRTAQHLGIEITPRTGLITSVTVEGASTRTMRGLAIIG